MPRLLVSRRLAVDPRTVVGPGIDIDHWDADEPLPRAELLVRVASADGAVVTLSERIDEELLRAAPRLRVVSNHAVGVDNVDVPACTARGVAVTNTPDVLTDATADLTLALILAVARRMREGEKTIREGRFTHWAPTMLLGLELRGAILGIVGFGRIGQAVAARARAFGMDVLCATRTPAPGVQRVELGELLARSDVVTLHCPFTAATRHLIGAPQLACMKRGAILVNTARGPIVDEGSLVLSLESGHLGGAGLDVFEDEPRVHPGLCGRDDVVLLPHVGSATRKTRARMAELALSDAARVLRGELPLHPRNEVRR